VDLKPYGIRPRAIKVSPLCNEYSVTMKASGTLLKMDMNFNILKSVPTAAKPYGESFDPAGNASSWPRRWRANFKSSTRIRSISWPKSTVVSHCSLSSFTPNLHQILQHTYTLLDVAQDRSDLFWTSLSADNTGAQCRFGHLGSTITAFFLDRMGSLPLVSARNLTLRHRSRGS
jgi:hypothetical protein